MVFVCLYKRLLIKFLYRLIAFLNACLYVVDGKTNKINVNNGGINDIKYPIINNHVSLADFKQPDVNEMIKRGIPRIINTNGPIRRFLCCCICSFKISQYFLFFFIFTCCRVDNIIIISAEIKLIINGTMK